MPNNVTLDRLELWQPQMDNYLKGLQPVSDMPPHRFAAHWIADLVRQADKEAMAAMGGMPLVKIVNPSPDRVTEAMQWIRGKYSHVALRYHPISEEQSQLKSDPVGTAKRHAAYWIGQIVNGPYAKFDRSKLAVMGINEPSVHNDAEEKGVALYSQVFMEELAPHSIAAWVFNFSVGWLREVDGRIVWDNFRHLERLINDTNSWGSIHEYWYPTVKSGWGSYANRISRCPMQIRFIIGECGYTRQLAGLPQPWGWDGNISAATYADQLWEYADTVDPKKVYAICPFTTSYGGIEWKSKDILPVYPEILKRKHNFAWPNPWPQYTTPPVDPPTESDPMLIIVPKYTGRINGFYGQLYQNDAGIFYPHEGLDIAYPMRTPIYAPADGIVAWADHLGTEKSAYGIYCRTYHPQLKKPVCFFNAHMSECAVKTGNSVKQGQLLGYSGNTGNSSGAHLHWEVRIMTASGGYQVDKPLPATLQNLYRQNGRTDPLAWLRGWQAAGGKVEER